MTRLPPHRGTNTLGGARLGRRAGIEPGGEFIGPKEQRAAATDVRQRLAAAQRPDHALRETEPRGGGDAPDGKWVPNVWGRGGGESFRTARCGWIHAHTMQDDHNAASADR